MPTAPGASRPTRFHSSKQSTSMSPPLAFKPTPPKRSASAPTPARRPTTAATPRHRPSTSSAHHSRSKAASPKPRSAQPSRSRSAPISKPNGNNSKPHSKNSGSGGRTSHSTTPHHSRSAGQKHSSNSSGGRQHVHRQPGSSSSRPVYVVCNRKHADEGFYARCQKILRRYVTWGPR
ncbi:hypothetical protein A7U60_g5506 [Sanghuangporus baumii]|uniref:Uncharacterized protein n=1 Tax=Sanghuangporus baumii TaxID=108892 RepID=A0A9Q5HWS2_SANBA|nr:hypothetical protein A7U60_g5506 [Sanghuangporus baumii]